MRTPSCDITATCTEPASPASTERTTASALPDTTETIDAQVPCPPGARRAADGPRSSLRSDYARGLARGLVSLPEVEDVPLRVLALGEPADPGHRHLVRGPTAELLRLGDRRVDVV